MKQLICLLIIFYGICAAQSGAVIFDIPGSVNGISDNGVYACGYDMNAGQAFIWTEAEGMVYLGAGTEAFGISNDGVAAGRFTDSTMITNGNPTWVAGYYADGRWHRVGGIPGIGPLDELSYTHAYSINASGTKMTGMAWHPNYRTEACYWNLPDTTIHLLGQIGEQNGRADDISNDGSIIVGWSADETGSPDRVPYYWNPSPHYIGSFDSTWSGGECNGISPDGSILVGTSANYAFRYTTAGGLQMLVDQSVWPFGSWASDASDNSVIVGHVDEGAFSYKAFIWKEGWSDVKLLGQYLQDSLGVTGISDWLFLFARGISADGKVFGGEIVNNTYQFGGGFIAKINDAVLVDDINFNPASYELKQNYPNPFNPSTTISFSIPEKQVVRLAVYNCLGEEAAVLINEERPAGINSVNFNASGLSSGIYLVRLSAGEFSGTIKMNFLK